MVRIYGTTVQAMKNLFKAYLFQHSIPKFSHLPDYSGYQTKISNYKRVEKDLLIPTKTGRFVNMT